MATLLQEKYEARKAEVNARFEQLRSNEEELNRIFAKIYNMEVRCPSRSRISTFRWRAFSIPPTRFPREL